MASGLLRRTGQPEHQCYRQENQLKFHPQSEVAEGELHLLHIRRIADWMPECRD
jgi:hypothetical protein